MLMSWKKRMGIKKLNITMYGDDNCPFTVKMKNELKKNKVFHYIRYIDVTDKYGKIEFESKNFEGVPVLHSELTNKSSLGYIPYSKIKDLISS
jgi:peroxiredoxin